MARTKRTVTKAKKVEKQSVVPLKTRFPNFLLAMTFIIVVLLLISLFFRNSGGRFTVNDITKLFTRSNSPTPTTAANPAPAPQKATVGSEYRVKSGDTVWSIAEEAYGSGYNSADIIASNKLINPNQIEVDQSLTLPQIEAKAPTRGEIGGQGQSITTPQPTAQPTTVQQSNPTEYVVQSGDNLWNIAVKSYGDGFMWTKIAQANKLANPHIIHSGNRLTLPRSTS